MVSNEMGLKSFSKTTPAEFFVSNHTAKRTSEIIFPCANPVRVSESLQIVDNQKKLDNKQQIYLVMKC